MYKLAIWPSKQLPVLSNKQVQLPSYQSNSHSPDDREKPKRFFVFSDCMACNCIIFTISHFTQSTPYRITVRQKKREVAVSSGVAHFSDKICAIVVSILRVFW